jgi:hypothetical protein
VRGKLLGCDDTRITKVKSEGVVKSRSSAGFLILQIILRSTRKRPRGEGSEMINYASFTMELCKVYAQLELPFGRFSHAVSIWGRTTDKDAV